MKFFTGIVIVAFFVIGLVMTYWKALLAISFIGIIAFALMNYRSSKRKAERISFSNQFTPRNDNQSPSYSQPTEPSRLNINLIVNGKIYDPHKPRFVNYNPFTGDEYISYRKISDFIAIDFKTANEQPKSVCSVGIAVVKNEAIVHSNSWLIRPKELRFRNTHIHGISEDMVVASPQFNELWESTLRNMIEGSIVVAYNTYFDIGCLEHSLKDYGIQGPKYIVVDALPMARDAWRGMFENYKLSTVSDNLGITLQHHDSESHALACAQILLAAQDRNIRSQLKHMRMKYPNIELDRAVAELESSGDEIALGLKALESIEFHLPCNEMSTDELSALHRKCGEAYFTFGRFEKAIMHFEKALDFNPYAGVKRLLKKAQQSTPKTIQR